MKLALLGRKLSHSFSKQIHEMVFDILNIKGTYSLCEVKQSELESFMQDIKDGAFDGANVTIPYKSAVLEYIDEISEEAKKIGAVNSIDKSNGKLVGYNTDYSGFGEMLKHNFIDIKGTDFAVLGAGGAAKGLIAYLSDNGAKNVELYSRDPKKVKKAFDDLSYNCGFSIVPYSKLNIKNRVLINATPVGMYPDVEKSPVASIDLEGCVAVVDLIYNPSKTRLMKFAEEQNVQAVNGLYMLVSQAIKAQEIWQRKILSENLTRYIYNTINPKGQNIVLIGMPGCGKSIIGEKLASSLSMPHFDIDSYIINNYGDIAHLFDGGEEAFRALETRATKHAANETNTVISTGGGVVTRKENMTALAENGTIIFIDRPLDHIVDDIDHDTRPLLDGDRRSVEKLYKKRVDLYDKYSHVKVVNDGTLSKVIKQIERVWKGEEL